MTLSDTLHSNADLQSRLQTIYGLHRREMDFRLGEGPYRDLLEKLGNPQNRLPPTIHVAGTNGKGSTIAMLRALAEQNGLRAHAYTSPHLFRFNERFRVAGKLIDDDALITAIDRMFEINDGAELTFFEFTTAMMFDLFARHDADLCLVETGMGGRLDCTNVMDDPAVTVITAIGLDHTEFLGDSIAAIATEKAGIMKPGAPCIVAPQHYNEVWQILPGMAEVYDVKMLRAVVDDTTPIPSLEGAHQRDNMAAAALAFKTVYPDTILPHRVEVKWPGRIMDLRHTPAGWRLIYDGAHNLDSVRVLAEAVKDDPLTLILALQDGKDARGFLSAFLPRDLTVIPIDLPGGRKPLTGAALHEKLHAMPGITLLAPCATVEEALAYLPATGGTAVITGSLYAAQLIPADNWPNIET